MTGLILFAMGLGSTKIIFKKIYVENPCAETPLFRQGEVRFDRIGVQVFSSEFSHVGY
jgi:hypothetical protein